MRSRGASSPRSTLSFRLQAAAATKSIRHCRAARKSKNINIRISEEDLASLKKSAEDEGIPYQTLISSVLHKYLSGRLVEEKHIRKSIELLARRERGT